MQPRDQLDDGQAKPRDYITPHRSVLTDYTPDRGSVRLGDKSTADLMDTGTADFNKALIEEGIS
jgi:hypothetical protein